MKLTELENQVLAVMVKTEKYYDEIGETGFSDVMLDDLTAETEKSAKTIRGVLGSLVTKDMVDYSDVNGEYNVYYLTDKAREHFGMETIWL